MRSFRAAVGLLSGAVLLLVWVTWPVGGAWPGDCGRQSGRVYADGEVVVFVRVSQGRRRYEYCAAGRDRSRRFHERPDELGAVTPWDVERHGRYVLMRDRIVATETDVIGVLDLARGGYRRLAFPAGSALAGKPVGVHSDGSVVYVARVADVGRRVWIARPAGTGRYDVPQVLVDAVGGEMDVRTLRLRAGVLRWRTRRGRPGSVRIDDGRARVARTPVTCDGEWRLYADGATRVVYRTSAGVERFYLCSATLKRPKLVFEKRPYAYPPLLGFRERDGELRFTVDVSCDECHAYRAAWDLETGAMREIRTE